MNFEKLVEIYNRLQDDESKKLFSLMLKKNMSSSQMDYIPDLSVYCHNPIIDDVFKKKLAKCDGIIVYGCGGDGRVSKDALERCGYRVDCFCDSNKKGIVVDGLEVINVLDAIKQYPNHLICVCSTNYGMQMYQNLLINHVDEKHIYIPPYGIIIGFNANQYIDTFEAPTGGVLVDGGAFDGETAKLFMNWVGKGNYSKIICYEPEEQQAQNIKVKIIEEELENVEVINAGLWDSTTELRFNSNSAGSAISSDGNTVIKCTTIDETIKEKVSFIKMDIEGAELRALHGAKKTIMRYKPKMAICIYHKKNDIYDIGAFFLDIWPDCKMKIRQYSTFSWETVLYVE